MMEYARTRVENVIEVSCIATVLRMDLRNRITEGDRHDFPEIFYMAEGSGDTTVDGEKLCLEAGQMVIYAPDSLHEKGTGGIVQIISFETGRPLPGGLCNRVMTLSANQCAMLEAMIAKALPLFEPRSGVRGMVLKADADLRVLQSVKNMLELFLLEILNPSEADEADGMRRLTDYLTKNMDQSLTLQEIGAGLGMSVSSLRRMVRKDCGNSPIAYFTALKIKEAKRLIVGSSLNVSEIADRLGFSSVHHFSRVFKQKTGMTPTEYEKTARA